jgi:hypothetical protein
MRLSTSLFQKIQKPLQGQRPEFIALTGLHSLVCCAA